MGSTRAKALKARGWEDFPFVERGHRDTYAKDRKRLQENERRRRQMKAGTLRQDSRGIG